MFDSSMNTMKRQRTRDQQFGERVEIEDNDYSPQFITFLQKKIVEKRALLACPVCQVTAVAPIYACQKMHQICSACYLSLEKCPECRTDYSNPASSRHRFREETAQELRMLELELEQELIRMSKTKEKCCTIL